MDATKPTDTEQVSALPAYIREVRAAVNSISGSGNVGVTNLAIPPGATSLTVGTDIGRDGYEAVIVSAAVAVNISNIYGGTNGQIKVFVFTDNNVGIVDGLALGGALYLNQLPALSTFNAQTNDVLVLMNIGGDGATNHGYWKEIQRQLAVK